MAKDGKQITGKREEELQDMMRRGEPLPSGVAFNGANFRDLSDDEIKRADHLADDEIKRQVAAIARDQDHEDDLARIAGSPEPSPPKAPSPPAGTIS